MRSSIPQQQKLVESYRQGVNLGQADVLSYYQAWNQQINSRIQLLSLNRSLVENRIALELATGQYCEQGVQQCFQ
jgi:outer membrane protein TolC